MGDNMDMGKSNTNFNLYKTFVTVYETRNQAKSAEILEISSVAVGQNIRELSNQLGVTLFNSHRKGTEPTAEADRLYPKIKKAIEAIIEAEDALDIHDSKTIRMAMASTAIEFFVRLYLKEFYKRHPDIKLEIFKSEALDIHKQRELDFIMEMDIFVDKSFKYKSKVFEIRGGLVASREFLAENNLSDRMTKEQLVKLPLICRDALWADLQKNIGADKDLIMTKTPSVDVTISMVKDSIGVGYVAKEIIAKLGNPDLVSLEVEGVAFQNYSAICAHNKPLSKHAKVFVDGFKEYVNGI